MTVPGPLDDWTGLAAIGVEDGPVGNGIRNLPRSQPQASPSGSTGVQTPTGGTRPPIGPQSPADLRA